MKGELVSWSGSGQPQSFRERRQSREVARVEAAHKADNKLALRLAQNTLDSKQRFVTDAFSAVDELSAFSARGTMNLMRSIMGTCEAFGLSPADFADLVRTNIYIKEKLTQSFGRDAVRLMESM